MFHNVFLYFIYSFPLHFNWNVYYWSACTHMPQYVGGESTTACGHSSLHPSLIGFQESSLGGPGLCSKHLYLLVISESTQILFNSLYLLPWLSSQIFFVPIQENAKLSYFSFENICLSCTLSYDILITFYPNNLLS